MGIMVTVIMSRGMPASPMIPPTARAGEMFGIMPMRPVFILPKTADMSNSITKMAIAKDLI